MTTQSIDDAIAETAGADAADRKPIWKANYKGVSFAVFPHVVTRDDGTEVTLYNAVIERRYKGKDEEYHSMSSRAECRRTSCFAGETPSCSWNARHSASLASSGSEHLPRSRSDPGGFATSSEKRGNALLLFRRGEMSR